MLNDSQIHPKNIKSLMVFSMFDLPINNYVIHVDIAICLYYNETKIYFHHMYYDYILFSFSYIVYCQTLLETCQVLSSDQIVSARAAASKSNSHIIIIKHA